MPWIRTIEPDEAQGDLETLYRAISSARGGIARVHRAQSLNPRALAAHLELYKAVMFQRSTLGRIARERIAVAVSAANECAYCVAHHGESLRQLGDDPAIAAALGRGLVPDGLSPSDRAVLEWARTAALRPSALSEDDVVRLRSTGLDDRAILDAALTVGYFSFVNRIVLLLGVHLEDDFINTCGNLR